MKTRVLTFTSALSLLLLVWVGLRTINTSRDCFNSQLVERLLIDRVEGSQEVDRCGRQNYFRFWESSRMTEEDRRWGRRIEVLERLSMVGLRPTEQPVQVVVSEREPFGLHWNGRRLVIGATWARAKGQLERILVQRWLRDQIDLLGQDVFQLEVLSYLLVGFLDDQLVVEDAWSGEVTDLGAERSWIGWAGGIDDYCLSPWVALEHFGFCENYRQIPQQQRATLSTISEVEKLTLAPLLASLLWRRYKESKLSEHSTFWNGLGGSLNDRGVLSRWQWDGFVPPNKSSGLVEWLNATTDLYWSSLGFIEDGTRKWVSAEFDIVIDASPELASKLAAVFTTRRGPVTRELVVRLGDQLLAGGVRRLPIKLDQFKSNGQVVIACKGLPSKEFTQSASTRVIIVDVCQSPAPIRWEWLVQGGLDGFIQNNPRMVFAALFMPAVRKVSAWPVHLRFDAENFQELAALLKWKELPWDDRLMAVRPLGVWDAVLYYRL